MAATDEVTGANPVSAGAAPGRPGGPGRQRNRRSHRDWVVDSLAFALASLLGLVTLVLAAAPAPGTGFVPLTPALTVLDVVLGAVTCLSLWWRRDAPVTLAILASLASLGSTTSIGAVFVLIFTVALHRRWVWSVPVIGVNVVVSLVYWVLWTDGTLGWGFLVFYLVAGSAVLAALLALGMFVRARRLLVDSLRERAERAEAEQQRSAQAARLGERTRIAREMHDVLAHRISLVSMHAGALEFRPDADPDEVAVAAGIIRQNAHLALQDLREVIGVLRSDPDLPDATSLEDDERPQPSLAALDTLLTETRATGATVRAEVDLPPDEPDGSGPLGGLPLTTSRTAYRVLQEGLTNARKHGRGGVVTVRVRGRHGEGLVTEVSNALRPASNRTAGPGQVPGTGRGLVGLAERTMLAGGRMEHGVEGEKFRLRVWLPWG